MSTTGRASASVSLLAGKKIQLTGFKEDNVMKVRLGEAGPGLRGITINVKAPRGKGGKRTFQVEEVAGTNERERGH